MIAKNTERAERSERSRAERDGGGAAGENARRVTTNPGLGSSIKLTNEGSLRERKDVFFMMKGFTFFFKNKDYFVETKRTNKTQSLAAEILPLIGCSATEGNIKALLYRLKKATCEVKIAEKADRKEKRYYEISGEGFGGCGGWIDDGSTVILKIN